MNCLGIIDGNGVCFAAAAANALSDSRGRPTGGVHGGMRMMKAAAEDVAISSLIVVWDSPDGSERRRRIWPMYKKRSEVSDEIRSFRADLFKQIDVVDELLRALGVLTIRVPTYEADDIIAALALMQKPDQAIIISNDKDFAQLIDGTISIYPPSRRVLFNDANFGEYIRDVMGAKQMVDRASFPLYRAIIGDSSDNIPGIDGIGPVLAAKHVDGCRTPDDLADKYPQATTKKITAILEGLSSLRKYMEVMNLRSVLEDRELVAGVSDRLIPPVPDPRRFMEITQEYELRETGLHLQGFQRAFRAPAVPL